MKRLVEFALCTTAAISFAACGSQSGNAPANNANTNTNSNTAKPVATAPTADALLGLDKQANEAYMKGDSKFFEGFLNDKFVMYAKGGQRMDKAAAVSMISKVKCDAKDWKLDDPQILMIDADTYVLNYKGTFDGTCTIDGKTEKQLSPVRAATVWVRSGDKWMVAFHGENVIIDPKNPAPPADNKKETPKKVEEKKDDKSARSSNSAASPAKPADPFTDALMAVEKPLWEAWKDHDAKKLEGLLSKDVSFVNIFGTYFANKTDAIKDWTGASCEAKSVSLTDGVGISISPTVGILTVTGSADGTCGGQKIVGSIFGTSVYVKDGDTWKWAFGFNSPG